MSFLEMGNIYACALSSLMNGRIDEAPVVLQVLYTNVDVACNRLELWFKSAETST